MAYRFVLILLSMLLCACASAPPDRQAGEERPMVYHDTRLQYALLFDDREMLEHGFKMNTDTSPVERVVAGIVLPFTVATETFFWPLSASIGAFPDVGRPAPGKSFQ